MEWFFIPGPSISKVTSIFFFFWMKRLLCNANFLSEVELKNYYIWLHSVNENDTNINDLFKPDSANKSCNICEMYFENSGRKKNHMFLFHHRQTEGSRGKNSHMFCEEVP